VASDRTIESGSDYPRTALLVNDDGMTIAAMSELAAQRKLDLRVATTIGEARFAIRNRAPHIVLCDIVLSDGSGVDLLSEIDTSTTDLVVLAEDSGIDSVLAAMRKGALNYLPKPVDAARLGRMLDDVAALRIAKDRLSESLQEAKRAGTFGALIGRSPEMLRVFNLILRVAPTEATVLIQGETGTGKELVAEAIVHHSPRRNEPYVLLNCGGVSPALIESELFGHERGAFTGAERRHLGIFERARNGTLFLDEITEMRMDLQVRLLRVLESKEFTRVGGEKPIAMNVRVIAATNRPPEEAIRDGKLRADLFYRLGTFPIHIPALRDRPGDAILIAEGFVERHNRVAKTSKSLTTDARNWISRQRWEGNVRELRNVVERGYIMSNATIDVAELEHVRASVDSKSPQSRNEAMSDDRGNRLVYPAAASGPMQFQVGASIAAMEKQLILATLRHFDDDKQKAAHALGISVKTLYSRLSAYRESASE
jgi:two-component system, NtrC family, response regulator AtoC